MNPYEIMLLLDAELAEERQNEILTRIRELVEKRGGSWQSDDAWGRRKLAFEIDKKTEGYYAVVDLTSEPAAVKELDRQLNLTEVVLRTKIMRPDAR